MRKIIIYVILLFATNNWTYAQQDSIATIIDFQTRKFRSMLETLYEYSSDSVDIYTASDSAFSAMLKSVNKQNAYYPKSIWSKYFYSNQGQTESIGITTQLLADTIFILDIDQNSPAEDAKIQRGGVLISVNNIEANVNNYYKINSELRAKEGDTILVKWMNYKSLEVKTVSLVCKKYDEPSIASYFVIPDINTAYIKISRFSTKTYEEFKELASKLSNKKKLEGIIIDLRDNSGGTLDAALKMINEFMDVKDTIFESFAKMADFKYNIISTGTGSFKKTPLIVLINGNSASASEIFAGAIQDLDRGILIGEKTFGKGTMQKNWNLIDTTGYKVTVAKFITPSGRPIEKSKQETLDIDPQLKLSDTSIYKQLEKRLEEDNLPTKLDVYYTKRKKRPIINLGGIMPDITCGKDTITLLTDVLISKGIMIEFVFKNLHLFSGIANNSFEEFLFNYNVSDEILQHLRVFSHNIKKIWNEEMFLKDKEIIRSKLKANIAHYFWGSSAFYAVNALEDGVLKTAIKNRNQAVEIIK